MIKTVADQFAEILAAAGIKRIYGIVGDSLNGLTDALRRQGKIEWVHMRHEEVAAFAAGAEAHLTGELAVCAGSCGPGNLHLINGLFDCHRSRVPVLGIAAHIPSAEIGSGYFQETHPETLFNECSHYCELISSPSQMPRTLEVAIRNAAANRGVSVVVMPGDVALQPASSATAPKVSGLLPPRPVVTPAPADLDRLAALLNGKGRVTLLCGSGCQGAHDELLALGDRLKAPMVHALRGKEHVEWDNPYDVGMTGLIGFASGYYAMLDCDVLLMLGTDFPYRQFYPQGSSVRIAQVDIRAEQIGRRAPVDVGIVGDVGPTLGSARPSPAPAAATMCSSWRRVSSRWASCSRPLQRHRDHLGPPFRFSEGNAGGTGVPARDCARSDARQRHGRVDPGKHRLSRPPRRRVPAGAAAVAAGGAAVHGADRHHVHSDRHRGRLGAAGYPRLSADHELHRAAALLFLSALFPVPDLPGAVRLAVRLNPLSYGVDGLRGALDGSFAFGVATDFAVLGGLGAILLAVGAYLFSKIEV
jgi:hypothetical protein